MLLSAGVRVQAPSSGVIMELTYIDGSRYEFRRKTEKVAVHQAG